MIKKEQKPGQKTSPKIPKVAFDPYDYKKQTYRGVDIYIRPLPWANCTFLKWMISHGAQDDKIELEGTAHFLEHVVFDGNDLYGDRKTIDLFSKEYLLDSLNAHTRFTDTCYVCKFLPQKAGPALDGMYHLIFKPLMRDEDVEHERKVITQEGWDYLLNDKYVAYLKAWSNNLYADIPEKSRMASPLGWIDTVAKVSKKDLRFAHKNYTRENSIIILTGVVNESIIREIKKKIDLLPSGKKRPSLKIPSKINIPKEKRWTKTYTEIGRTDTKQAVLEIDRVLEVKRADEDTLGLISIILREILFRRLRHDNSWCYGVGVNFFKNPKYISQNIWVKVAPENLKDAENIIWDTIDRFIKGEYKEDCERERKIIIDRTLASEFLSGDIAETAEREIASGKNIRKLNEYLEGVVKADYDKAVKHLSLYFKKEDVFTEITIPEEFKGKVK
jgi:predicted Zn-dependent peptidase